MSSRISNFFLTSFFLLLFFSFNLCAQDIIYARKIIDTLSSPAMHGRGYVNDGDKIAANYIVSQFVQLNLKKLNNNYFQVFSLPMNTFPGMMKVVVDKKELVAGKDFIVAATSGSAKKKYKVKFITKETLPNSGNLKNSALIIDPALNIVPDCETCPLIFLEKEKLTKGIKGSPKNVPAIHILESAIPKTTKKIFFEIENKYIEQYTTQNIISYIKGSQYPDSFIVFSAHYDHLGRMGKDVYFPGANDNASGCAMLLNIAKYFSEHPPKYSIAFMAFGAEEAGLVGSKYYTEHPLFPLKQIKFLINLDLLGTGDEGITVVNGAVYKNEFDVLVKLNNDSNYLAQVKPRGKAANSDHYHFSENGVKSFFIYTNGGIKAYHDVYDRPETLPLTKFEDVFKLLVNFTNYLEKP